MHAPRCITEVFQHTLAAAVMLGPSEIARLIDEAPADVLRDAARMAFKNGERIKIYENFVAYVHRVNPPPVIANRVLDRASFVFVGQHSLRSMI